MTKRLRDWLCPLDKFDKALIGFLTVWAAGCLIAFIVVPSWEWAGALAFNLLVLAQIWRAAYYEGLVRIFRPMTDLGAMVGEQLHTHGELLITKHGGQYRIIPLHDVERNT